MANEIPLLTASKGLSPEARQLVVNTIIQRSHILNVLPILPVTSGFTIKELENVTGTVGNPAFRALNEDFSNSYSEFRERVYGVKQLGDAIRIDKEIEKQIPGTLMKQTRLKLIGLGMFIDDKFFNGNSTTDEKEFDGLKTILGDSGTNVIGSGSGYQINSSSSNFNAFLDDLDEGMRGLASPANAIFVSDVLYDAITSGARLMGAHAIGTATDFLGRQVNAYRGVPFIAMGKNQAGTDILPLTEALGSGSAQTSAYIVSMSVDDGVSGISTGGINILPDEDNLFYRDVISFSFGLRVPTNSVARVTRLKVA